MAEQEKADLFDSLHEIHTIACAAAHALKCIDLHLEMHCDVDGFTYEDAAGCVYTIKRAIFVLSEITRYRGLKSDPLYPEWGPSLNEMFPQEKETSHDPVNAE